MPKNSISNLINKEAEPSAAKAFAIAQAMGYSLEWLVDEKSEWPPITVSDLSRLASSLDEKTSREFDQLARNHHGRGVCLAAAIRLLLEVPEELRAKAIFRAQEKTAKRKPKVV